MPFALTHKGRGEQLHAKLWVFLPAKLQRTPISKTCMRINLRSPQGTYQLNEKHLLTRVKSIRTWLQVMRVDPDKHSQSIYGPSVIPLESPGRDGVHQVSLVALGGSKAMQEFLVLHYLATDSASEWDVFLDSCLPECTWVRAGPRRALALHMCDNCHIVPSHRRFAHPSWIAGMKLMLDLLLGAREHRYLGSEVYVRGFSAGSYSGICLLHLLWNMPHVQVGGILGGISCAPALIHGISPEHGQNLMLIHLTTDRLCKWHPYDRTLSSLNCKYCVVDRTTQELKELFGSCEHSYGHWIDISLFFFLHCRTSARHCRSTTGMSEERKQISPKAKANKNKHTNKATPTKPNQAKIQGNLQKR